MSGFREVSNKLDVPALERSVIERWRERATEERYLERNAASAERFSFLDGPITANNPMGVHHAWGRTYKDLYQRYHTMLGHRQRYQNGFDCQGLWIEVEVERELGFRNKRDIEAYGIDRFVEKCKERVDRFAALITEQSRRLGMWMDWDHSYYTNSPENNYAIWAFLKRCHERGLVYKGHDVMPWCPRCGTGLSNAEVAEGYRELKHLSLTLRYALTTPGHEGEWLVVWTTTPWTLSSNVAAAVHPDLVYQLVEAEPGHLWWVSRGSRPRVAPDARIVREAPGAELVGLEYAGAFDELPAARGVEHRVIPWNEVSDDEGTGIVHIAPGCGQEDFALSKEHGLTVLDPIDDSGVFRDGYGWQTGRYAGHTDDPDADVAPEVAADLAAKGVLVSKERYAHHYPVCWRCSTQLLFHLVDEWFVAMDPLRAAISDSTRGVTWLPPGIGLEERELDWLRNMGDWMISKKRYYGLALPIWVCQACAKWEVIGGREELRERAVAGWQEFDGHTPHRPWVDGVEIACTSCGGRSRRIADVGNPWLDAGIVPFSTLGWTAEPQHWAEWFPADFVTESFPGQFRNWFYALLTMSTVITERAPMKTLFGYALMRDEHGEEMHKSKGNAIWFDDAAERIGADVMRWMFAATNPATNLNFGPGPAGEVVRRFILPLWNTYSFFVTYARVDGWRPGAASDPGAATVLDRWILSRLDATVEEVRAALDGYDAASAVRSIEAYVDELSNWYVRRNRRRFWKGELDADKHTAYATLHEALGTVVRLMAPVAPHLADAIWENLVVAVDPAAPESVHLSDFPVVVPERRDVALEGAVALAQRVVALGRSARAASGIRVRQPLSAARVKAPTRSGGTIASDPSVERELVEQILEELNVKRLEFLADDSELVERSLRPVLAVVGPRRGPQVKDIMAGARSGDWRLVEGSRAEVGGVTLEPDEYELVARPRSGYEMAADDQLVVALDTSLDAALEGEGLAREVAHRLQSMRRDAGYAISDRIEVAIAGDAAALSALAAHEGWLASETLAERIAISDGATLDRADRREQFDLDGARLDMAVGRPQP